MKTKEELIADLEIRVAELERGSVQEYDHALALRLQSEVTLLIKILGADASEELARRAGVIEDEEM